MDRPAAAMPVAVSPGPHLCRVAAHGARGPVDTGRTGPAGPASSAASLLSPHLAPGTRLEVTVTVPDDWTAGGAQPAAGAQPAGGARAREELWAALTGAGARSVRVIEASVAAAAWWALCASAPAPARDLLVLRIACRRVTAARCTADLSGAVRQVRLLGIASSRYAAALGRVLLPSAPPAGHPGTSAAAGDDPFEAALAGGHRRAAVVLPRARQVTRYRTAMAYRVGGTVLTAGAVLDALTPAGLAIRSARSELGPAGPLDVLLTGGPARLPLARAGLIDAPGDAIHVLDPEATVRGAAAIAAGDVVVTAPAEPSVLLERVAAGLLEVSRHALGDAPAVEFDPPGEVRCESAGVRLMARIGADETARGPWTLGWWPDRDGHGTLVLRPVTGEPGVLAPLRREGP